MRPKSCRRASGEPLLSFVDLELLGQTTVSSHNTLDTPSVASQSADCGRCFSRPNSLLSSKRNCHSWSGTMSGYLYRMKWLNVQ